MCDRCVPDHLSQLFATLTGEKKHCDTVTDDLLKKEQKKEIEGGGVKNCTSTTMCMSLLGITMESFIVTSVTPTVFRLRDRKKRRDRSIWYRSVTVMKEKSEKWTMRIELLEAING